MREFAFVRPTNVEQAVELVTGDPDAAYLAGGTTLVDLMKDGVLRPRRVVDIARLPLREVIRTDHAVTVGALTTMEELAAEPVLAERAPVLREALLAGASTQLRNMATIGGNLLQRARCRYFRDPSVRACNKRSPGSGCAAVDESARMHAILGAGESCIALHASDLAVALVALDAVVHLQGTTGTRRVPLTEFYRVPGSTPERENVLEHGQLITAVEIPLPAAGTASGYLKIRDRASYEFALVSAAAVLEIRDGVIHDARMGLGGVGTIPWRAPTAESLLRGARPGTGVFRAAAASAIRDTFTVPGTAFKVALARRTIERALSTVSGGTP
ncbi:xanthine dehydrogenase family protein subunit M [Nonomuraea glycinis]|uniref:FAD-binding molybdopterin dehydrogenase n=1 Tax=Nonomuraea glycinis TaxID=2047744 RepID=A0A918AFY2_9ACTN|nr:xanthine dehydrogenase family protein subunit M [Nonomuraea glycinis]MCA2176089.1 xanthine dehydrogenase family protein subunit M [Nonomuraea glycinis]GGP17958.1 FAD-binding molybdopterin dehydrogenase [Nonomuraea glycinis]